MKFTDLLVSTPCKVDTKLPLKENSVQRVTADNLQEALTPEDILRKEHYKIKLVTPTKFGTQIDFMKKYDEEDIKDILKDFTLKFSDKSVFVID